MSSGRFLAYNHLAEAFQIALRKISECLLTTRSMTDQHLQACAPVTKCFLSPPPTRLALGCVIVLGL